ncbi:helix-turn-helix domain-containing protein [Pseudarthrobacter sp. MDT1-22]
MTAQLPLPASMDAGAVLIGAVASLVEDEDGGRVFVHGELSYVWDAVDGVSRRFAAAKLADIKAGSVAEVAAAFGVDPGTLWRWRQDLSAGGVLGLAPEKSGPKGPSRLTEAVMSQIRSLRATGLSLRAVGTAVGVSEFSVRRTLAMEASAPEDAGAARPGPPVAEALQEGLPVLPAPVDRSAERAGARSGLVQCASPVFAPAARVPLA